MKRKYGQANCKHIIIYRENNDFNYKGPGEVVSADRGSRWLSAAMVSYHVKTKVDMTKKT